MKSLSTVRSIAILRHISMAEVVEVAEEMAAAGIDVIEVTLNTQGALGMIEQLAKRNLGEAILGAGTVTDPDQARQVAEAGGRIAISPNSDSSVISAAKKAGLIALPGCLTPSEAYAALKAGADGLKIFPCEMVSPAAFKGMKAILPPEIPLFAVGGIGPDNAGQYLDAGAAGVGVGSCLYKPGKSLAKVRADTDALVQSLANV